MVLVETLMSIECYKVFPDSSTLTIIGDVKLVLNGAIDETNMNTNVLEPLKFALGAGSFSDCSCVGETIILNHIGYTSHLDKNGKLVTIHNPVDLRSPFLMGLLKQCHPKKLFYLNFEEGITLNDLFNDLEPTSTAFAFVGSFLFKNLACSYIKKPPIYRENINTHADRYWAKTEFHAGCNAYLFGVVVKEKGKKTLPKDILGKAFYSNPLEKNEGSLLSHTHGVLIEGAPSMVQLKKDLKFYEHLDISSIMGARHVFTQSVLQEGVLSLFDISDIKSGC